MFGERSRAVIGLLCFFAAVTYAVLFLSLDFVREAGDWVCFGCTLFALLFATLSFAVSYTDWVITFIISMKIPLLLNLSYAVLQLAVGVLLVAIPSVPLWVAILVCAVLFALELALLPPSVFLSYVFESIPAGDDTAYSDAEQDTEK